MFEFELCKQVSPDVIKKLFLQKDDSSKSQPAGATRKRADKVGRSKDKVTVLPKGIYMDMAEATDMLKSLSASQPFADLDPAWKQKTDAEQNLMSQQVNYHMAIYA